MKALTDRARDLRRAGPWADRLADFARMNPGQPVPAIADLETPWFFAFQNRMIHLHQDYVGADVLRLALRLFHGRDGKIIDFDKAREGLRRAS